VKRALDLFAGAGGWDIAAEAMGWETDGVEIMAEARATRESAGLRTLAVGDVRRVTIERGQYDLLLASPPCQTYSMAGNGDGRRNMDRVLAALHTPHDLHDLDDRTGLVLEPLRIALEGMPRAMAWEQVPAVLPVWQACAKVLRAEGYSVATAILNSEQYGVPQTRRRAVLMARRDQEAALPRITHSRFHSRSPERLDAGVKPWVSMAEALGWGMTQRPSMTVCGGGTDTGGAEPFGNGARRGIVRELEAGRWVMRANAQTHACVRGADQPAPTITGGHDTGDRVWVQRSNYSAGSSDGRTAEERGRTLRTVDQPALTFTSKGFQWESSAERIRVSPEEAACLQTFPTGFPFQGNKGKRFQQIGNAVPPVLAGAILEAVR
jgi:DNA (cytosine-5)-methyltransferase 1